MNLIKGNLFEFEGEADVFVHGCNCFCTQGAGIAKIMSSKYDTLSFRMEQRSWRGNANKLGNIDFGAWSKSNEHLVGAPNPKEIWIEGKRQLDSYHSDILFVVNGYTQFKPGPDAKAWALESVIWKTCQTFAGRKIYVPMIGAGIGGLDEDMVLDIFSKYPITVVQYEPTITEEGGFDQSL